MRTHKRRGEGSSQMRTIAYKEGGGFKVAYVRKKNFFWTTKSQNFSFFVQNFLLHCHLLLCTFIIKFIDKFGAILDSQTYLNDLLFDIDLVTSKNENRLEIVSDENLNLNNKLKRVRSRTPFYMV